MLNVIFHITIVSTVVANYLNSVTYLYLLDSTSCFFECTLSSLKIHVNLIYFGECALDCIPRHYKRGKK